MPDGRMNTFGLGHQPRKLEKIYHQFSDNKKGKNTGLAISLEPQWFFVDVLQCLREEDNFACLCFVYDSQYSIILWDESWGSPVGFPFAFGLPRWHESIGGSRFTQGSARFTARQLGTKTMGVFTVSKICSNELWRCCFVPLDKAVTCSWYFSTPSDWVCLLFTVCLVHVAGSRPFL